MSAETWALTDSHCHLAEDVLFAQLPDIIAAAKQAGVSRFLVPAVRRRDWERVIQLSRLPEMCAAALGLHPWFDEENPADDLAALAQALQQYPALWVGEIGLDFHRATDAEARARQTQHFVAQLDLAQQYQRPIVLHHVRASAAVFAAFQQTGFKQGGIAHAFSGSVETAQLFIKQGFKIGIGMMLLNPNAKKLRHAAAVLPLDALVLETDSPFMRRDAVNTPASVRQVAETLAQLRGESLANIAMQTEANLNRLFFKN